MVKSYTKRKLVEGVGINDADYVIARNEILLSGKQRRTWVCPFYSKWTEMIKRCYSEKYQTNKPTYRGCTVCEEWLTFSNFKAWMEQQDWEGKQLDKDLLVKGNKVYSPDTCIFVDNIVNAFTTEREHGRGEYMIGVSWQKANRKFRAACSNTNGKQEYLGLFDTELEAHLAWKKRKHEYACQLAESELVSDPRLAEALKTRYV